MLYSSNTQPQSNHLHLTITLIAMTSHHITITSQSQTQSPSHYNEGMGGYGFNMICRAISLVVYPLSFLTEMTLRKLQCNIRKAI